VRLKRRQPRGEPAAAPAPPPARYEYKAYWTQSAGDHEHAKRAVVANDVSDDSFWAGGEETCGILRRTIGIATGDTVLEVGCGIGRVGRAVAPICREWIGSDVSPTMLDLAREHLAHLPNVRLVETSGYDLAPIDDGSVYAAYCSVVFMHLDEWDRYSIVAEAHRVVRPGGRFYIDNFNLCSDAGWALFEQHRQIAPHDRPPNISRSSTPAELETYLARAGFENVVVEQDRRDLWVRAYGVNGPS
jgi:ubiquinone/menaquinone biosynthesis C-methylase UbiE